MHKISTFEGLIGHYTVLSQILIMLDLRVFVQIFEAKKWASANFYAFCMSASSLSLRLLCHLYHLWSPPTATNWRVSPCKQWSPFQKNHLANDLNFDSFCEETLFSQDLHWGRSHWHTRNIKMESKIKISNLQFICTVTVLVLGALISLFLATHDIFLLFISLLNLKRQTFWWVWNIIFLLFSALTIRHIKLDWLFSLDNFGHYSSFQHRKFSILKDYNIFYLLCRRRKPNILKI